MDRPHHSGTSFRDDRLTVSGMGPRMSTPDTSAISRINELEDELAKLRQQIATIVMMQEQSLTKSEFQDQRF